MRLAPIAIIATILFILPIAGAQFGGSGSPFDPNSYDWTMVGLSVDSPIKYIQRSGVATFNISVTDLNPMFWDAYMPEGQSYLLNTEMDPNSLQKGYVSSLSALSVNNMAPGETRNITLIVVAPAETKAYEPIKLKVFSYRYDWQQQFVEEIGLQLTVIPTKFSEFEVKTQAIQKVTPGSFMTCPVEIRNYGNYYAHVAVDVFIDKGWTIVLPQLPLLLDANSSTTVPIGVYVPERFILNENAKLTVQVYDLEKPKEKKANVILLSGNGHYIPYFDSSFKTSFSIPGFDVLAFAFSLICAICIAGARKRRK
ncbi:MAG: hypothetical protein PHH26_04830 [Candidatus Thermoplasmatota archaeon]|nr:hypothetical protein [Candidatus Thermoplasmatota archaeon]